MEPIIKTYSVKVVREPGENPLTGEFVEYDEQSFDLDATSVRAAYSLSHLVCTLRFSGQLRRTFVDGHEYFDERY
jgi:hypothetical protein